MQGLCEECYVCSKSGHSGEVCPSMQFAYNCDLLGMTWEDPYSNFNHQDSFMCPPYQELIQVPMNKPWKPTLEEALQELCHDMEESSKRMDADVYVIYVHKVPLIA